MSNEKELTPVEAYAALLDGKVIKKNERYFKKIIDSLRYRIEDGPWHALTNNDAIAGIFLELNGYRLVKEKRKVKIEAWVNVYWYQGSLIRRIYEYEHQAAIANDVPDGECLIRAYKIENEVEVEV